jgi:hypothetical protein
MSCTYACLKFTLHGMLLGYLSRDFPQSWFSSTLSYLTCISCS